VFTDVRQYDVCLSYASEDSEYVDRVSKLLKKKGIKVYSYKDQRAVAWARSLTSYLKDIYRHKSKFCVVFLSKDYASKEWPQYELLSAFERAFEQNRQYLVTVQIDDTKLPGMPEDVVYESSATPAEQLVDLIVEKIRVLRAQNRRRYALIAGIAVIVAALLFALVDSRTTARFADADEGAIYLYVSNKGWKQSHLLGAVIEFDEPKMIENTPIGARRAILAAIPRLEEQKKVRLEVFGLRRGRKVTGQYYTDKEIDGWLRATTATVWLRIEESDDLPPPKSIPVEGKNLLVLVEAKLTPQERRF
jgi:TIR domain